MHRRGHLIGVLLVLALPVLLGASDTVLQPEVGAMVGHTAPRAHAGMAAPPLQLRALNSQQTVRLYSSNVVNVDHFCGGYPHYERELCVVMFVDGLSTGASAALAQAKKFDKRWAKKGVLTVLVMGGVDSQSDLADKTRTLTFPVLSDANGVAARAWGVTQTPGFFVLDGQGTIRVEGNFDLLAETEFASQYMEETLAAPAESGS